MGRNRLKIWFNTDQHFYVAAYLLIFKACTRYLCINRIHDRVLQELHHDEPLQPLKVLLVGLIHSLQMHNNKMNVPSISRMACVLFFYSGRTPTLSWLTSARKRLCILYRSSFRGSCQYCACTKLTGTNAASDKADRTDRNSELFRGRKSNQEVTEGQNVLLLNPVPVCSRVEGFAYHVAPEGALAGTLGQAVHPWAQRNTRTTNKCNHWQVAASKFIVRQSFKKKIYKLDS